MRYEDIIRQIPVDSKRQVESAKTRFNLKIRERLNNLLLRLNLQGGDQAVQNRVHIDIVSAKREKLFQNLGKQERSLVDFLQPYKREIDQLETASKSVHKLINELDGQQFKPEEMEIVGKILVYQKSLTDTGDLAVLLQKQLQQESFTDMIYAMQEDVLGCYKLIRGKNEPLIELYYEPIALIAADLGVRIESLTAVVLIHELAHAYTHLGRDYENAQWETNNFFHNKNLAMSEGLAQYYTDIVSRVLGEAGDDEIRQAYLRFRRRQAGVYRIHDRWVPEFSPEVMRDALIKFRRNQETGLVNFENRLGYEREALLSSAPGLDHTTQDDIKKYGPLMDPLDEALVEIYSEKQLFLPLDEFLKGQGADADHLRAIRESIGRYSASNWNFSRTKKYIKATQSLVKSIIIQINDAITEIAKDPMKPHGDTLKPLKMGKGFYRYRIGDNRLVYYVDRLNTNICLYDFGSRGGIYD